MRIDGKTALVLGAAKGIGKAVAFEFARQGATVILTYYDWPEATEEMRRELAELGIHHLAVKVDLRQPQEIEDLFKTIGERYERLDILVNNIERGGMPVVHGSYVPEQWDLEMDTTVKAKWWVMRHAMPLLKKSGQGAVVTFSSIAGVCGRSGPAGLIFNDGYAAANRAVSSFTETWAREGAPEVRINELMLGFFETRHAEGTRGWGLLSGEQKERLRDHILLKRTGRLDEIVRAVLFLVRDAEYMTGSVIRMDGGYLLGGDDIPPMPAGVA